MALLYPDSEHCWGNAATVAVFDELNVEASPPATLPRAVQPVNTGSLSRPRWCRDTQRARELPRTRWLPDRNGIVSTPAMTRNYPPAAKDSAARRFSTHWPPPSLWTR